MKTTELRKQICMSLPLSDWKALHREAARRRIPMTELCRQWMRPDLERLRGKASWPECRDEETGDRRQEVGGRGHRQC